MTILLLILLQISISSKEILQTDLLYGRWEVISLSDGAEGEKPKDLYITFFAGGKCVFEYEKEQLADVKWTLFGSVLTLYMEEGNDVFQIKLENDLLYMNQDGDNYTLKQVK